MNEAENLVFYAARLPWHVEAYGDYHRDGYLVKAGDLTVADCGHDQAAADFIVAAVAAFDPTAEVDRLRAKIGLLEEENADLQRAVDTSVHYDEVAETEQELADAQAECSALRDRVVELEAALEAELAREKK